MSMGFTQDVSLSADNYQAQATLLQPTAEETSQLVQEISPFTEDLDLSSAKIVTLTHLLDAPEEDKWKLPIKDGWLRLDSPTTTIRKNRNAPISITLERGQPLIVRVDKVNIVHVAPYFSGNLNPEKYAELLIQSKDYFNDPLELVTNISHLGTHLPNPASDPAFEGETVELCWLNHFTGEAQIHDLYWQFSYCIKEGNCSELWHVSYVNIQPITIHLK